MIGREQRRFEAYKGLLSLTQQLSEEFDFDVLTQKIVDLLSTGLGFPYPGCVFFRVHSSGVIQAHTRSLNPLTDKLVKTLPFELRDFRVSIDDDQLLARVAREKRPIMRPAEWEFIVPLVPPRLGKWIDKVAKIRCTVVYPVFVRRDVRGLLLINSRDRALSELELEILPLFLKTISAAISNSIRFSRESERRKNGKVLLEVSSEYVRHLEDLIDGLRERSVLPGDEEDRLMRAYGMVRRYGEVLEKMIRSYGG